MPLENSRAMAVIKCFFMIEEDEFEAMDFCANRIWKEAIKQVSSSLSNKVLTEAAFTTEIVRVAKEYAKTFERGYISSHGWLRPKDVQVYLNRFRTNLQRKIANVEKDPEVVEAWGIYRSKK
jgi:tRNA 2-selenouridine synthase SelU